MFQSSLMSSVLFLRHIIAVEYCLLLCATGWHLSKDSQKSLRNLSKIPFFSSVRLVSQYMQIYKLLKEVSTIFILHWEKGNRIQTLHNLNTQIYDSIES